MPKIQVAKGFTLTLDGGERRRFEPGAHEVDDAIAGHWFVQAHLVGPDNPAPEPPAETVAKADLDAAQARIAELEAMLEAAANPAAGTEADASGGKPRK